MIPKIKKISWETFYCVSIQKKCIFASHVQTTKKDKKKFGIMKEDIIFALSESQMIKLNAWKDAIFTIYGEYGLFTYSFRPTQNSLVITVESDLIPNRMLDLTETNY